MRVSPRVLVVLLLAAGRLFAGETETNRLDTAISLSRGDAPITRTLNALDTGIYSLMVHGSIDPQGRDKLGRVWRPCPMEFELRDAAGRVVERGRMLLKQSFTPQRMQGFHFHINEPGDYTATFRLSGRAQETVRITRFELVDHLKDVPNEAVKRAQHIGSGKTNQLAALTEDRRQRDDAIWKGLPPLNTMLQVHDAPKLFRQPPASLALPKWDTKAYAGVYSQRHPGLSFAPLDFVNAQTGEVFPHEQIVAGEPWPGEWSDDGTGVFFTKEKFPELPHDILWAPRATLLGYRVKCYLGLLGAGDYGGRSLAKQYFEQGDPNVGHDAAMALVRLAYDWPAVEMNLHELRLCSHSPDLEFNTDWTGARRNGKYFYDGWSGANTISLLTAYDQVYPYIQDNQAFAEAVHRFIPWINTPQDVVRYLDRGLVFASVRDVHRGLIRAAPVEDMAARVLGPGPFTEEFYDLTKQQVKIYPYSGTYQELYATALNRSGSYHAGSFLVYAFGDACGQIGKARLFLEARRQGVKLPMDISDLDRYPKIKGACDFIVEMWPAGGFPFMLGDASGGPHTGPNARQRLTMAADSLRDAWDLAGDPRHAWILSNWIGETNATIAKAAADIRNPILHAPSRVVPGYGAILECGVDETNLTKKTAATLRVGIGQAHTHSDYLDLNLFALGLPVAVDLACRTEGNNWTRPKSGSAGLHNMAIAHDTDNFHEAGGQTGEPWIRSFAPPLVRASYVNREGTARLDRDVILMQVGEADTHYAFDLQRLRGGKLHTWSFHGCESDDLALNVPMEARAVRWIDRMLEGTHKVGQANDTLQATWTMTRAGREIKHSFNGGGVIKTAACEPVVLGAAYDSNAPPVRVRATLLGHAGEAVMQGNPYSEAYSFCFPFLWVQREANDGESLYPAIYEWYRGGVPVIEKAELVQGQVRVTTTSGQVDAFTVTPTTFSVVSRDKRGIRFAKLNGGDALQAEGISIKANRAAYRTTITEVDYRKRTLRTKDPLPANPRVTVGNQGHRTFLELRGSGTSFAFDDELLCHEGQITKLEIKDDKLVTIESSQKLFQAGNGNRKLDGFTVANEDLTWQFRAGKVIRPSPVGELSEQIFTDANRDGRVHVKTYEIGLGDEVELLTDVTVWRTGRGYEVTTNARVDLRIGNSKAQFDPSEMPRLLKRR
jgi:hypothetical protein